jgi:hypothetical protein
LSQYAVLVFRLLPPPLPPPLPPHRLMCLAPYLPGGMVVAIAIESATLYYIVFNKLTSFYIITQQV